MALLATLFLLWDNWIAQLPLETKLPYLEKGIKKVYIIQVMDGCKTDELWIWEKIEVWF